MAVPSASGYSVLSRFPFSVVFVVLGVDELHSLMNVIWAVYIDLPMVTGTLLPLLIPLLVERLGRVRGLALSSFFSLFPHLLQFLSPCLSFDGAWSLLFLGRLLQKGGFIIFEIVMPTFVTETSPPEIRGALGSLLPIGMAFGTLLAGLLGLPPLLGTGHYWPLAYLLFFLLTLPALPLCLRLKETPAFLLANGKTAEAKASFYHYRGEQNDSKELRAVAADVASARDSAAPICRSFSELCLERSLRRPLKMSLILILPYTVTILLNAYSTPTFQIAGFTNETAAYLTLGMTILSFCSFLVCFFCIDRYGRRPLVVGGLFAATICWTLMLLSQTVVSYAPAAAHGYARFCASIVFCLSVYASQVALNVGVRPVFWVLVPEVFPFKFRSVGKCFTMVLYGLYNFLVLLGYYPLIRACPLAAHALVALSLLLSLLYAYWSMPETKGKQPHEIYPELMPCPSKIVYSDQTVTV